MCLHTCVQVSTCVFMDSTQQQLKSSSCRNPARETGSCCPEAAGTTLLTKYEGVSYFKRRKQATNTAHTRGDPVPILTHTRPQVSFPIPTWCRAKTLQK